MYLGQIKYTMAESCCKLIEIGVLLSIMSERKEPELQLEDSWCVATF